MWIICQNLNMLSVASSIILYEEAYAYYFSRAVKILWPYLHTYKIGFFFLKVPKLCMLGNFSCFCCRLLTFFKIFFFKKIFQEHYQSVKQFVSRSLPTFCRSWSGSKQFANVISRQQKFAASKKGVKFRSILQERSSFIFD